MHRIEEYRGHVIMGDMIHAYVGRAWFYTVQQARDAIDAYWKRLAA
jgi:hypothetical protein